MLATTGEGCPGREVAARGVRPDEKSARGAGGATDHPSVHGVDAEPYGDEAEPGEDGRDRVLRRNETETPLPERRPEWKRSSERAAPEQAGGVAPPVAGAVVPGDDETENE